MTSGRKTSAWGKFYLNFWMLQTGPVGYKHRAVSELLHVDYGCGCQLVHTLHMPHISCLVNTSQDNCFTNISRASNAIRISLENEVVHELAFNPKPQNVRPRIVLWRLECTENWKCTLINQFESFQLTSIREDIGEDSESESCMTQITNQANSPSTKNVRVHIQYTWSSVPRWSMIIHGRHSRSSRTLPHM